MPKKPSNRTKSVTKSTRTKTRNFSILKIGAFLSMLVFVGVVGAFYNFSGKVQGDYSNILGVKSDRCLTKADVNCDSTVNSQDVKIITDYLKKPSTSPAPTPTPKVIGSSPAPTATPPSSTPPPGEPPAGDQPFPGATPCPTHSTSEFHTLWNAEEHCHYDHEHGQNPFTVEMANTFPGMNLRQLLGNVEIGHTNPSSAMENTHKHGGFKWQFMPQHPQGCAGFEGSVNGVNGSAVQVHGFGDFNQELTGRIHSSAALFRLCNQANPTDYGYLYTVQFQDYGQIVSPYQGDILPFPFTPQPSYNSGSGPYLTIDCVGQKAEGELGACRPSLQYVIDRKLDSNSNWAAKPGGNANTQNPFGSTLFNVFFRLRDTYQLIDWSDKVYPFTYKWLCSRDGGNTYDPTACKYNNSTIQVHEVAGRIPTVWDNLQGFDSDSRVGRITATGYTDRFGVLMRNCTAPSVGAGGDRSADCFPIKMVNAFVGTYGSVAVFTPGKGTNIVPYLPEKDIYFCNGQPCGERDAGAVPSGWIGTQN